MMKRKKINKFWIGFLTGWFVLLLVWLGAWYKTDEYEIQNNLLNCQTEEECSKWVTTRCSSWQNRFYRLFGTGRKCSVKIIPEGKEDYYEVWNKECGSKTILRREKPWGGTVVKDWWFWRVVCK